jgi:hypothetical protein
MSSSAKMSNEGYNCTASNALEQTDTWMPSFSSPIFHVPVFLSPFEHVYGPFEGVPNPMRHDIKDNSYFCDCFAGGANTSSYKQRVNCCHIRRDTMLLCAFPQRASSLDKSDNNCLLPHQVFVALLNLYPPLLVFLKPRIVIDFLSSEYATDGCCRHYEKKT